ncbi:MAG: TerB N-terminal domain-containing protein [Oscillospiraceae bacterium]|jgi:hypothetical protein|nr:TerB N-terminal domain-containing protein [Oscillospiraceae bacterium]
MLLPIKSNEASNALISLYNIPFHIPPEIIELLWFKNGPYANYKIPIKEYEIVFGPIKMLFSSDIEPSLIDLELPISETKEATSSKMDYYPSYRQMLPEQRTAYLNWLCDITQPVDIGYVYVFYYGLERYLLTEKFEKAFIMVSWLMEFHNLNYAKGALIYSCILHRRYQLLDNINPEGMSPGEIILLSALTTESITSEVILEHHKSFGFSNARYIKSNYYIFKDILEKNLIGKYGAPVVPVFESNFKQCEKFVSLVFANISFYYKNRVLKVPDVSTNQEIRESICNLLTETHEQVKSKLRKSK